MSIIGPIQKETCTVHEISIAHSPNLNKVLQIILRQQQYVALRKRVSYKITAKLVNDHVNYFESCLDV